MRNMSLFSNSYFVPLSLHVLFLNQEKWRSFKRLRLACKVEQKVKRSETQCQRKWSMQLRSSFCSGLLTCNDERKGVSVLLFVQQKVFGMYCTCHIALHYQPLSGGNAPDNRQHERAGGLNPRTGRKQEWKTEAFQFQSPNYWWRLFPDGG